MTGSPFAPHTSAEAAAMLESIGVADESELFDIPTGVEFDDEFGIPGGTERTVRQEFRDVLSRTTTHTEFLGRGHYDHYVPSVIDHLADRSEFLTAYTQYQPEIAQGFLQALFEYQSLIVELTGLGVANCSMYDTATALGEAATLASRVRQVDGHRILVPEMLRTERRAVLENYIGGTDLVIDEYSAMDGNLDPDDLAERVDSETVMVYAENPTVLGTIEEHLQQVGKLTDEADALFVLGSDPVALALLTKPTNNGVDAVIGDASVLGLPMSYGMGMGLFATKEEFVRQVPGRLVGAGKDLENDRAYTLTLQTREQHIRRERATSNICTNQAWVALRVAMHAFWLGADGLVTLAKRCVKLAEETAIAVDSVPGISAPVHDRHHFREFVARTDRPAETVVTALANRGFAVHQIDDHRLQICVTETTAGDVNELVAALEEVA